MSTLDLAAFGQSVHLYAAGQRRQKAPQQQQQQQQHPDAAERVAVAELRRPGPLDILRGTGGGPDLFGAPPPGDLPSPLLLSRAGALAMLALTEAEAADATPAQAPAPKPLGSKLPDLHLGSGGLALTHSRAGAALCGLAAGVLNRLTANGLAGLAPAASLAPPPGSNPGSSPFAVRLSEGGPLLTSVEQLLAELEEAGHAVDLRLSSNLTSFGVGFSIRCADGGSWQQVPLAYPLRTGLWAVSLLCACPPAARPTCTPSLCTPAFARLPARPLPARLPAAAQSPCFLSVSPCIPRISTGGLHPGALCWCSPPAAPPLAAPTPPPHPTHPTIFVSAERHKGT